MKSRAANCAMRTPDSAARPACMRFIMPPPVPAAKLLMPDAVEHASPAAASNLCRRQIHHDSRSDGRAHRTDQRGLVKAAMRGFQPHCETDAVHRFVSRD